MYKVKSKNFIFLYSKKQQQTNHYLMFTFSITLQVEYVEYGMIQINSDE